MGRRNDLMLIANVDSSAFEEAMANMKQVGGYRGPHTICTTQPMTITRIRIRPFQTGRRICKVRIPKQKDGRSVWPQQ